MPVENHRELPRLALALLAGAVLAAVFPAPLLRAQGNAAADALPLQIGNSWTYDGTIWWVPFNSRRVLEERVTLEVEVVDAVQWGRMRGAILKGFPRDLVTTVPDRFEGEFALVQIASRIHLLRGEAGREAIRRLRERDASVAELVADSEVILDLPLVPGKAFCSGADPARTCWSVEKADPVEARPAYGLRTGDVRERYVLSLRSGAENEVWGFVPGVGFTSFAIGHYGDPSALELELVDADLVPARGIFLKTLDLAGMPAAQMATGSRSADDPSRQPPPGDAPDAVTHAIPVAADIAAPGLPAGGSVGAPGPGETAAAPFESAPPPGGAVESGPPVDADADGVPDEADRCAGSSETETVDRFGCPLQPPRRIVVRHAADEAPVIQLDLEELPVPEYEEPDAACVDDREWFLTGKSIEFDGRVFDPIGTPEPISLDNLVSVGEYDGVPLYVGVYADRPPLDVWLPVCRSPGTYRLYADLGSAH